MNYLKQLTELQGSKYVIEKVLGQGGFGITYLATQVGLNRKVALKEFFIKTVNTRDTQNESTVLTSSENRVLWNEFKSKFLKEARTIASLSHPGIISIYDVFEENGTAYYSMEYIENGSLKGYVDSCGKIPENKALSLFQKTCESLALIHKYKILHLDIKPDNIMLRDSATPVIIDFGISKRYDSDGNQTSTMQMGHSRGYAPLEQYKQGGLDLFTPATDIYSITATLYYMLSGSRPPEPNEIFENGLPAISSVSSETMDGIRKGMSIKISDRPQSSSELLKLFPSIINNSSSEGQSIESIRKLIMSLEKTGAYKEAYNRCLDNIKNGIDVDYSNAKAEALIVIMRKKNSKNSFWTLILVIVVSMIVTILSVVFR